MSSKSESVVQKWLRENVQTYPNSNIVYAHTDAALTTHPTIRPKTDVYSSVLLLRRPRALLRAHAPPISQPSMTAARSFCSVCTVFSP